ncbi:Polysaccharide deacetylase [Erythrobacter sp. NAP1]|uniref:polysaccharide deacetylase family protein n=1 Tax=Erythrobacter sp. NAP1 TaxID=237727 RepID=UPI0000686F2F|nr:polysaccharide deacetylase family protein [Erythrobacter sp. NAP1]EAQ30609.1 Polysaccharide deacetylase [Erythrobacter sp. NAP1]
MPHLTCVLHHHIGEEGAFERGLGLTSSREAFERQLAWLDERYTFVSLDQVLSGDLPDDPLLLTFDDAWYSVLGIAREVLGPRGIPAVYFINPGMVQEGAISLDSMLAYAVNTFGIEKVCGVLGIPPRDAVHSLIVKDMARLGSAERQDVVAKLIAEFGPIDLGERAPLLSAHDLKELVSLGIEIGNHTKTHVHCRSLSAEEMQEEIAGSKAMLEELSQSRVRSLSIPYGHELDLTDEVHAHARQSGHEAIFLVHARANWLRPAKDVWYRRSLTNQSNRELASEFRVKQHLRSLKKAVLG